MPTTLGSLPQCSACECASRSSRQLSVNRPRLSRRNKNYPVVGEAGRHLGLNGDVVRRAGQFEIGARGSPLS